MKIKKITLNAKTLRIILSLAMIVFVAGAVGGFIFAKQQLEKFATSISQMEANAAGVDGDIATLKQLQTTLKDNQDIKDKANAVTVPASDYPVAVIANITNIANQAGVKLVSVNYGDDSANSAANGTQTTPTPGATSAPTTNTTITPNGVTKKTVNVTTETPVSYDALMNFIKGIENDEMYMHITKVSLTKAPDASVNAQPFSIEVYVRQ